MTILRAMARAVTVAALALSVGGVSACSAELSAEDNLGELSQAFGSSSCGTALADRLYAQDIANPPAFSPTTYNTCYKGYVVDVEFLNAAYAGTLSSLDVSWNGAPPQTQAACEAAWGAAIYYKKIGGVWVDQTGLVQNYGFWDGSFGFCLTPVVSSDGLLDLEAGATYRIAGTMRPSYGSSTTVSMKVETATGPS
jgi:hypothetical protein